jgi:hypothetical protein
LEGDDKSDRLDILIELIITNGTAEVANVERWLGVGCLEAFNLLRKLELCGIISEPSTEGRRHVLFNDIDSAIQEKDEFIKDELSNAITDRTFDFNSFNAPIETVRFEFDKLGYITKHSNGELAKVLAKVCILEIMISISKKYGSGILETKIENISDIFNAANFTTRTLDVAIRSVMSNALSKRATDFQSMYNDVLDMHKNDYRIDTLAYIPAKVAALSLGYGMLRAIVDEFSLGKWSLSRGWPEIECFNGDEFQFVKVLMSDEKIGNWHSKTINRLFNMGAACQIIRIR